MSNLVKSTTGNAEIVRIEDEMRRTQSEKNIQRGAVVVVDIV